MKHLRLMLILVLLAGPTLGLASNGRLIGVVVDTSGSMSGNDGPRTTVQVLKLLADMLGPNDVMTVATTTGSSCSTTPSPSAKLTITGATAASSKGALDSYITYGPGSQSFAQPIATVAQTLEQDPSKDRLLLLLADADSDSCGQSHDLIRRLKAAGVQTGLIKIKNGNEGTWPDLEKPHTVRSSAQLVAAFGDIYQRFLGAKAPTQGRVAGDRIELEVAPFVREAFVLIAGDGAIGAVSAEPGNPPASALDLGYRAGETNGRQYRVVRLERPQAGTWRFRLPGLSAPASWLLIQDFSVEMRFKPPKTVVANSETPLTLELVDDKAGRRIEHPSKIPGLVIYATIDGQRFEFRDDGRGGDPVADDGLLTAKAIFRTPGPSRFPIRLENRFVELEETFETEVITAVWRMEPNTPEKATAGRAVLVSATIRPDGPRAALREPDAIAASLSNGVQLMLRDDGQAGDLRAGDGIYARQWTPKRTGEVRIDYEPRGGTPCPSATGTLLVMGTIRFGDPDPIDFGELTSHDEGVDDLDLSFVEIVGSYEVKLSSSYGRWRSALEVDLGEGFRDVDEDRLPIMLEEGGQRRFPARLRVGRCPEGVVQGDAGHLLLEAVDHDGRAISARIPIRLVITEDTWLTCWWPVLAAIGIALLTAFMIYGIVAPARFSRTLRIILSPEADLDEGIPLQVKLQPGSRSGFYRNASIHIGTGFRLHRSREGALARLKAEPSGVYIQPVGGNKVLILNAEGEWVPLPAEPSRIRMSALYRNESGQLFFAFRNH